LKGESIFYIHKWMNPRKEWKCIEEFLAEASWWKCSGRAEIPLR
jgi:hypothetical protein